MKNDQTIQPTDRMEQQLKRALDLVGDKWSPIILFHLYRNGPSRFIECQHCAHINTKTLSQRLVSLEKAGLISKKEFKEYPPRSEYSITDKGKELAPVFSTLADWAGERL